MEKSLSMLEARKCLGLTQVELANMLNVTPEYISMIENGKKNPSAKILAKLNSKFNSTKTLTQTKAGEPLCSSCTHCQNKDREIAWLRLQLEKSQDNLSAALAQKTQPRACPASSAATPASKGA